MIKFCLIKWDENNKKLREVIANKPVETRRNWDYDDLVYLVATTIYEFDLSSVHSIVHGGGSNYQGTLVFLIPMSDGPETECEWLMSYIGYGSCTVCDTLQGIQYNDEFNSDIDAVDEYMNLCRDIVSNTICPYNNGWRQDDLYDTVTVDDTDAKDSGNYTEEPKNTDVGGTHLGSMLEEFGDKFGLKILKDHTDDTGMWNAYFIIFDNYREFVLKPTIQALQSATTATYHRKSERELTISLSTFSISGMMHQWHSLNMRMLTSYII